jgi:hypothetical protein
MINSVAISNPKALSPIMLKTMAKAQHKSADAIIAIKE